MGPTHTSIFGLIFIQIFFLLGCRSNAGSSNGSNLSPRKDEPELRMSKVHVQFYGEQSLQWEMVSPQAQASRTEKIMKGQNLQMTLYKEGKKSTTIDSREGFVFSENENSSPDQPGKTYQIDGLALEPGDMYLKGDVVVVSTDGSKLTTDWLWFHRAAELITSSAPVRLDREDSITNGVGLEATPNLSSVKIFDQTLVIKSKEPEKKEGPDNEL